MSESATYKLTHLLSLFVPKYKQMHHKPNSLSRATKRPQQSELSSKRKWILNRLPPLHNTAVHTNQEEKREAYVDLLN